jgi:transposase
VSLVLRAGHRIFVFSEYIDLRAGFDKLSMLVRDRMRAKLVEGDLFVFFGRNRKRCKALCYDGSGVLLLVKRLEHGRFMRIEDLDASEITTAEFALLFRGSVIRRDRYGESALTRAQGFAHSPA